MTPIPQLRIRTEFSFKKVFGSPKRIAETLKEMGCPGAAIVDQGTWGHYLWEKHLNDAGVTPLFGTEVFIQQENRKNPSCCVLASDMQKFYAFATAVQRKESDKHALLSDNGGKGLIRFAGAALKNPDEFDYIDINPASILQQRAALALSVHTGKPIVITSDNWYPRKQDYSAFMALSGRQRMTPQHILSTAELRTALPCLDASQWSHAVRNTFEVVERCATKLPHADLIKLDGDFRGLVEIGRKERVALGHISNWDIHYDVRLEHELNTIEQKGFESYFLVVADLINWAKRKMLCGPGRGSSAGSLVCYLLRITEVDPIRHGLLFERFIDVSRDDWPDIDLDFNDTKRDLCFTYLEEKYGKEKVARIGSINTLKPRSVLAKICEGLAIPDKQKFDVVNVLLEHPSGSDRFGHSLEDTFLETEPGRRFIQNNQEALHLACIENTASHTGVHAAGVIVCNSPVSDYCTVGAEGIAQLDKGYAEAIGLLKIDALGLRTLGIIEDSGVITAEQLYALKLDDPKVFEFFNSHRYTGVFQFEGQAQKNIASQIDIRSFTTIDHITALARPGPMGGGATRKYIDRAAGREEIVFRHPSMEEYLGPTMGVILYQEQVMRICVEIGKFSWEKTAQVRKLISKSKGRDAFAVFEKEFIAGAKTVGMKKKDAEEVWTEICTFGGYGMAKAHTVSYSVISYWCAYMKVYHSLEYAAACLRNAIDDKQTIELLRDMDREGINYIPFDSDKSALNWQVIGGELVGGFTQLDGVGPAKGTTFIEQRNNGNLDKEKLEKFKIKFSELYPLHSLYKGLYEDPVSHGCSTGSVVSYLNDLPAYGDTLTICRVVSKSLRDENEPKRVARRGAIIKGQTLFLDVIVSDDTGVQITLRVNRFGFLPLGQILFDRLEAGDDLLVRAKRIPDFNMLTVIRVKCLNREVNLNG